jgi:hypothetical protein
MHKLDRAHAALVAQLASLRPSPIRGSADSIDVENRIDHLQELYCAVTNYLDAVVADTADHLPVHGNRDKVELVLFDLISEDNPFGVIRHLDHVGVRFGTLRAAA